MYYVCVENNVKIAVEDLNPKSQMVLVFVHGWPLNRKIFENQMMHFSNLGYRCISFDLRGFGDSDIALKSYHYNQLANDLYHILKTIQSDSVTLIGFSTSAGFLLRYLSLYQEYKVNKLILLSPVVLSEDYFIPIHENNQDEIYQFAKTDIQNHEEILERFRAKLFASTPSKNMKSYFKRIDWCGSKTAIHEIPKSFLKEDMKNDYKCITIPIRIIHGKRDLICSYTNSLALKHKLHNTKLFILEHSGHSVLLDHIESFHSALQHCIEN